MSWCRAAAPNELSFELMNCNEESFTGEVDCSLPQACHRDRRSFTALSLSPGGYCVKGLHWTLSEKVCKMQVDAQKESTLTVVRVNAWTVTVLLVFPGDLIRGGHRLNLYAYHYCKNLLEPMNQLHSKILIFVQFWEPGVIKNKEEQGKFEKKKFTILQMDLVATWIISALSSNSTLISVRSNWLKVFACSDPGSLHDCYIAFIAKSLKNSHRTRRTFV